jgi:hypothetical protein
LLCVAHKYINCIHVTGNGAHPLLPYILVRIEERSKSKAIPVTGRGGLYGCEISDNRLTDGGEVVSSIHWPRSTPQKHYFSAFRTHFC